MTFQLTDFCLQELFLFGLNAWRQKKSRRKGRKTFWQKMFSGEKAGKAALARPSSHYSHWIFSRGTKRFKNNSPSTVLDPKLKSFGSSPPSKKIQ